MSWHRVRPALLLSAAILLAIFAPAPFVIGPSRCGEGVGRSALECYWFYETLAPLFEVILRPLLNLVLVPGLIVIAVWTMNKETGRAMSVALGLVVFAGAVLPLLVYSLMLAGFPFPGFFQNVVIIWPQRMFFVLYYAGRSGGPLLPWRWAQVFPAGFWAASTLIFGLMARRVKSMPVLLPLAATFVVAVVFLVGRVVPILGWRIGIETP